MNRLLRRPEVESITGLSRAGIYAKMQKGEFPAPVRLGSNSVAWRVADIEAWIESLPPARLGRSSRAASRAAADPETNTPRQ